MSHFKIFQEIYTEIRRLLLKMITHPYLEVNLFVIAP